MSATFETARNEIFAIFNTAWVAAGDYTVLWPDVAGTPPEGSEDPWARVQLNHVLGNQNGFGPIAQKRWNREGFLLVQVFTAIGKGGTQNYQLCQSIVDAYQGVTTDSGIWFRNPRINEVGNDGHYYQNNAIVDFEYQQVT
jgi:hypothetical protein